MNSFELHPRLSEDTARLLRKKITTSPNRTALFDMDVLEVALASSDAFPPTGGNRVTQARLLELRAACVNWANRGPIGVSPENVADFDLNIGRELSEYGRGSRGEMGHPRVWDFLTLILLPDLAVERLAIRDTTVFASTSTISRLTGGDRRHVFQRLWKRWTVFGAELVESDRLTEDDYAQMLERRLTGDRAVVARLAAHAILESGYRGSARRDFTRLLMRQLLQVSGIVHIGEDNQQHLEAVFARLRAETTAIMQYGTPLP